MKTKVVPKKQRQRFVTKVAAMLLDLGAEPRDFEFALQTKVGLLKLHPSEDHVGGLGTIFTRFDDPQAAKELVNCNPFSGKWNFHFFAGWSVEAAIEELACQLKTVLA